jgi:hypothetical protein
MAFPSSASYSNLAQGNFTPVIYSKNVLKYFRKSSVVEDITNTDYYGEIANFGDTVRIINEPSITVSDYRRGASLVNQDLIDDQQTLTIDQAKYFKFSVDDIEAKQAHINWETMATTSAAYALKDSYDTAILAYINTNCTTNVVGTDAAPSTWDMGFGAGENSPLATLSRLARLLDEDNVPTDNRWVVANPAFWEVMQDENSKLMGVDFTGDNSSILRNGRVCDGLIRGFKCYKSNNMPSTTSTGVVLAGHKSAIATASQIAKTEVLRSENTFADIVRGLHVYGRGVLRETALAKAFYTID